MKFSSTLLIAILSLLLVVSCSSYQEGRRRAEANKIIAKIDNFNTRNHRLPTSLPEIGIVEDEKGPIYYQKVNDAKYVVWFGTELGESETFDSETRKWTP